LRLGTIGRTEVANPEAVYEKPHDYKGHEPGAQADFLL
jgi:hypothetical protein